MNELDAFLRRLERSQRRPWGQEIRELRTAADVRAWARRARRWLVAGHGGFPERTPLRAQCIGVIRRRAYRVEKIIYESRPRHFVTASVYVPARGKGPFPAVVHACGHYAEGKAHPDYQRIAIGLAMRGFVACVADPMGQGERGEYVDPGSGVNVGGCAVGAHHLAGKPSLLLGRNAIHFRSWDKIRAIDYLCSRTDVDAGRLGFCGHSGGGQMAYLLCGLDDRIRAAAISSGSGSCEHPQFKPDVRGARCIGDNLDYVAPFVPRPLLVMMGETEHVYRERLRGHRRHLQRLYGIFGKGDRFRVIINEGEHDLDRPRREAVYAWMIRWLNPGVSPAEGDIRPETQRRLNCTRTGNTLVSLKSETVVSLNTREVRRLVRERGVPSARRLRTALRGLLAVPDKPGRLLPRRVGSFVRDGRRFERVSFQGEPGRRVPALLTLPIGGKLPWPTVIFLDDRGKDESAASASELAGVSGGAAILSLDVAGVGESAPPPAQVTRDHPMVSSVQTEFATRALKLGRPVMGLRVNDVLRAVDCVEQRKALDSGRVFVFGIGSGALWAVCAAALDKRIRAVCAADLLLSYAALVGNRFVSGTYPADFIPGILKHGDVADVLACVAPRPLAVFGSRDHLGTCATAEQQRRALAPARRAYRLQGAQKSFVARPGVPDHRRWDVLTAGEWIRNLIGADT